MDSLEVLLVLVLIPGETGQEEKTVEAGADATLDCQGLGEENVLLLAWTRSDLKKDDYVFFYREKRSYVAFQHPSFKGRVKLGDPKMKGGNMSIILHNTTFNDSGTYECRVSYQSDRGHGRRAAPETKHKAMLKVTPPGQPGGTTEDEEEEDGGEEGGGEEGGFNIGHPALVASLTVAVILIVAFGGFMMYKKHKQN